MLRIATSNKLSVASKRMAVLLGLKTDGPPVIASTVHDWQSTTQVEAPSLTVSRAKRRSRTLPKGGKGA